MQIMGVTLRKLSPRAALIIVAIAAAATALIMLPAAWITGQPVNPLMAAGFFIACLWGCVVPTMDAGQSEGRRGIVVFVLGIVVISTVIFAARLFVEA